MNVLSQVIDLAATAEVVVAAPCVLHAITVAAPSGGAAIVDLYDDDTVTPAVTHGATVRLYYGDTEVIDGSYDRTTAPASPPSFTEDDDYEASTGVTQTNQYSGIKLYSEVVGANSATVPVQGSFSAGANLAVRYTCDLTFVRGIVADTSINDTTITVEYTPSV